MTPPSVTLRPVTAADTDFLAAVYASTRMEELSVTDWTDEQKAGFCLMQFQAQDAHYRQHYSTAEFSVILHHPDPLTPGEGKTPPSAGETSLTPEQIPVGRLYVDRWKKEIRIMDIAILPAHRGKGIGTQLLTALQQEAATAEKSLSIHVERLNPALHLYDRLGFRMIEDKGVYLLMEWNAEK